MAYASARRTRTLSSGGRVVLKKPRKLSDEGSRVTLNAAFFASFARFSTGIEVAMSTCPDCSACCWTIASGVIWKTTFLNWVFFELPE